MDNRIRPLREAKGWSQQDLADAAGTSQQQVARVESGQQSVRLDLAAAIANALEAELTAVFPGIGRPPKRRSRRAAADGEPATWLIALHLRGGAALDFVVSSDDARRLRARLAERDPASPFITFRSSAVAAALNLDHLVHYQELWDGSGPDDWHDERIPVDQVAAWLPGEPDPVALGAASGPAARTAHRDLLALLDAAVHPREFITVRDADDEDAFFRAADLALLTIPLVAV